MVKEWEGFNQQKAGVLTGESRRWVTQDFVGTWTGTWSQNKDDSLDESSLSNCMDRNLLGAARDIKHRFGISTGQWGPNGRVTTNFSGRESPDYVFRVGRDVQVAIEMKRRDIKIQSLMPLRKGNTKNGTSRARCFEGCNSGCIITRCKRQGISR